MCCCLWLCLLTAAARAQYRFDSWTTDNGLPQASVNSILQTRDGFLWFATFGGLVRYDGLRFQVFNTGNTKGLRTGRFVSLFEDRDGNLWINTEGQGLTRYKDDIFTTYTTAEGLPSNQIGQVAADASGNVLIEVGGALLQWKDGAFTPYTPATDTPFKGSPHLTRTGVIWYRDGSTLRKVESGRVTATVKTDFDVRIFYEDRAGRLWLGARDDRLFTYEAGELKEYSEREGYSQFPPSAIGEDRQGSVWFGTNGKGLFQFADGHFTRYTTQDGLVGNMVRYIYQDRESTLWVGTESGLSRLTKRVVNAYSSQHGLASDNVYPIYEDRQGNIWIGSWYGLTRYADGVFTNVSQRYGVADTQITSLMEDNAGGLWIGAWGAPTGLSAVRYVKDGKITLFRYDELPAVHVRAILQDRAGRIWFGTANGLVEYADGRFTPHTARDGLAGREVQVIHEDRRGDIWVGADNGLTRYRDGVFTTYTEKDGVANNIARAIYEDGEGALWVGMYDSGLYRFKDGRFTHYTTLDGLFDNGVFRIIEDGRGNFWISCNLGIYRVSKDELNAFAEGRALKVTSVPYNKHDGMLNSECNGGGQPAGIRARDGRIWFPTQGGVAVIDPDRLPANQPAPSVVIESFIVDTQPVSAHAPVKLQPGQVNVEIHYSGLSFINPELVKFKYRLEGLDTDWVDAGTRRTAYYAHLPPGRYYFRVKAANRDGVWNEEGAGIEITVSPPFWRTWWFILLAVCSLALIAFLLYRRRVLQLERARRTQEAFSKQLIESQERERKRIAAELHDSLGQSLLIIKNRAYLGLNQGHDATAAREQLREISVTVSDALQEVREIAYYLRPSLLEKLGLTSILEEMLEKVATSSDINFSYEVAPLDGAFSPEAEINFFRVVQECVNNIIKHSEAAEASIVIERNAHGVRLLVEDDGKGFAPDDAADGGARRNGFGLTGLAERVRMLGGGHSIHSARGAGTIITVTIKTP